jgi:hypothetical protein
LLPPLVLPLLQNWDQAMLGDFGVEPGSYGRRHLSSTGMQCD